MNSIGCSTPSRPQLSRTTEASCTWPTRPWRRDVVEGSQRRRIGSRDGLRYDACMSNPDPTSLDHADEAVPLVTIRGESELAALDKVLREAKFSENPHDPAIAGSSIVADLARRTRAASQRSYRARPGENEIGPGRREWNISLTAARRAVGVWTDWGPDGREKYVRDLLSPYDVSGANVERFIREAEESVE